MVADIGIGWAARHLMDPAFLIGMAFGVQFIPVLFAGSVGGVIDDHFGPRVTTIVGNVGMAIPAIAMGVLVQLGWLTLPSPIGLALLGDAPGTDSPASVGLVPHFVAADEIGAAVSPTRSACSTASSRAVRRIARGETEQRVSCLDGRTISPLAGGSEKRAAPRG